MPEKPAEARIEKYSFEFDRAKGTWICSVHGDVGDGTAWVPCWNGCEDGYFDAYEDDPINNYEGDLYEGDLEPCRECYGEGGWTVCGQCNANNPDKVSLPKYLATFGDAVLGWCFVTRRAG